MKLIENWRKLKNSNHREDELPETDKEPVIIGVYVHLPLSNVTNLFFDQLLVNTTRCLRHPVDRNAMKVKTMVFTGTRSGKLKDRLLTLGT